MKLSEIKKELLNQDNRATANPLFIVYEKEMLPTTCDYSEDWDYLDTYDGASSIGKTKEEVVEYCKDYDMDLPKDVDDIEVNVLVEWLKNDGGYDYIDKIYYFEKDRFVQAFFTEKSANKYIEENRHNLRKPYTYVIGMYRNDEMCSIRDAIMNLKIDS